MNTPPTTSSPTPPAFHRQDPSTLSAAQLAELVRFYDAAYWQRDEQLIPDQRYDQLVERLRAEAPDHPVLREIGGQSALQPAALQPGTLEPGDKVEHAVAMLSLGKCYTEAELLHWARELPGALVASPKIDGAACSVRYDQDGRFVLAATRGDGRRGESIGHNVRAIPNVPTQLPANVLAAHAAEAGATGSGGVEVRGEVYLPLSAFKEVEHLFSNPRNVAAGALKAKDSGGVAPERLRFFAYDLLGWEVPSETAKAAVLRELGFDPAPTTACTAATAQAVYEQLNAARATDDFETDGVVYKVDDIATQRRLGSTAHHPRWAIAYKYQGDSGESTLQRVEWSLARTGTITPVAIVAPVLLSGAMVSRATLHNLSNLERLDLKLGDRLMLTRRGGVIPHVEGNLGGGAGAVSPPSACPSCGGATVVRSSTRKVSGEEVTTRTLHCAAPSACPVVLRGQLFHFTRVLELDGFGEKILDQLLDHGLVRDAADLYTLTPQRLLELERMGPTLAEKLVATIQGRREVPLATLLVALGIETLGKHAAGLLASRWTLEELRTQPVEAIAELHSLGTLTATQIVAGLRDHGPLIDRLLAHLTVKTPATAPSEGPLAGHVVVFTGKLSQLNRRDAQQLVVRSGGRAASSVTREVTMVVVGGDGLSAAKPSSKIKKARKLKEAGQAIELMSEADFHAWLAEARS